MRLLTANVVKTTITDMNDVETVTSPRRAACLVGHPLRPRILASAREPVSASELARRLGQPRQRVNYHVRQLARDGFLVPAGQQRKRNMVEQPYVASARAYLLTPAVLGDAAPPASAATDPASAAQLISLCAHAQNQVAQLVEAASAAGVRVRTLSLQADVALPGAEQRAAFLRDVSGAINDVVARYTGAGSGGAYRLLLGCYPVPE
jgi:biotin operon repressor